MEFAQMLLQLIEGLGTSVAIFVLTLIFSLPLGFLVCFGRMSKKTLLRSIVKIYISVLRGTPLMLQLIVVYFAPYYLFGLKISTSYRFIAAIIAFSVNYSAYFAEIYRSGIESIPVGQYEASEILGYSKLQTFIRIIFPQVVKRTIPPVTNEVITLVKDTSLASVLALVEMFAMARQIAAAQTNIMPLMVAGVFYYIFNFIVAQIMEFVERKFSYYR